MFSDAAAAAAYNKSILIFRHVCKLWVSCVNGLVIFIELKELHTYIHALCLLKFLVMYWLRDSFELVSSDVWYIGGGDVFIYIYIYIFALWVVSSN